VQRCGRSWSKQIVDNVSNEGNVISGDGSENADDIYSDSDELVEPEESERSKMSYKSSLLRALTCHKEMWWW
jgi:hypothetical protein